MSPVTYYYQARGGSLHYVVCIDCGLASPTFWTIPFMFRHLASYGWKLVPKAICPSCLRKRGHGK